MKTDDLINALIADGAGASPRQTPSWWVIFAGASVFAMIAVVATVHIREDIGQALSNPRLLFKFVATFSLAIPAAALVMRIGRPVAKVSLLLLLIAPVVLAGGVVSEMLLSDPGTWEARLLGAHALFCVGAIPVFSLVPFAMVLMTLRQGAPTHLRLAGALAGLMGGAIGAAAYVLHCPDDSPFFLATWYSIAVAIVTLIGAIWGPRFLRW